MNLIRHLSLTVRQGGAPALIVGTFALLLCGQVMAQGGVGKTSQTNMGQLDVNSVLSAGQGVSGDGSVVTGTAYDSNDNPTAFLWTPGGGMTALGGLGGTYTYAYGVSGDGSIVVGDAHDGTAYRAVRWANGGAPAILSAGDGGNSSARGISSDGMVIVGNYLNGGHYSAFRWTQAGGMSALAGGTGIDGNAFAIANAANSDGTVIVGQGTANPGTKPTAFRWTQADGMVSLGYLGTDTWSEATGVSGDGSVVIGSSGPTNPGNPNSPTNQVAFRWTQAGGMTSLGTLAGGGMSVAKAISGDGQVVVGQADIAGGARRAFRWTAGGGMQSVDDWLRAGGVTLVADITKGAYGTNQDGSIVVGVLNSNEAFIARASGLITPTTFNTTLTGSTTAALGNGVAVTGLALFGSHHRPLMDNGMVRRSGDACGWATVDGSHDSRRKADSNLSEFGVCRDFGDGQMRAGLGLGTIRTNQDMDHGGSARIAGQYLVVELDYAPDDKWIASATLLQGNWSADIRRGYLNAGTADISSGRPGTSVWALRGRLDRRDISRFGDFALSPFVSLTHTASRLDGYTETGGGFPAQFDAQSHASDELRAGVVGRIPLSGATDLRLTAEAARQMNGAASNVSGQVIGLYAFSFAGTKANAGWGRIGTEIDHRLDGRSTLSAGMNVASSGGDPAVSASVSWKMTF